MNIKLYQLQQNSHSQTNTNLINASTSLDLKAYNHFEYNQKKADGELLLITNRDI